MHRDKSNNTYKGKKRDENGDVFISPSTSFPGCGAGQQGSGLNMTNTHNTHTHTERILGKQQLFSLPCNSSLVVWPFRCVLSAILCGVISLYYQ